MKRILLALALLLVPVIASAQVVAPNDNVQGQAASNQPLTNPVVQGCRATTTGSLPPIATSGNQVTCLSDEYGVGYVRLGGPLIKDCSLAGVGTSLTQCIAAPSSPQLYLITDITVTANTAASGFALEVGTGTNCATGTAFLYPSNATIGSWQAPVTTAGPLQIHFTTPLVAGSGKAVCVVGTSGTNTINIQLEMFVGV